MFMIKTSLPSHWSGWTGTVIRVHQKSIYLHAGSILRHKLVRLCLLNTEKKCILLPSPHESSKICLLRKGRHWQLCFSVFALWRGEKRSVLLPNVYLHSSDMSIILKTHSGGWVSCFVVFVVLWIVSPLKRSFCAFGCDYYNTINNRRYVFDE